MSTGQPAHGDRWSDAEFRAALAAYARVLQAEQAGRPVNKSDVLTELNQTVRRTRSSLDYRMRNISAVLQELGSDWIEGYKPMKNYPRRLKELIQTEWTA